MVLSDSIIIEGFRENDWATANMSDGIIAAFDRADNYTRRAKH